MRALPFVPNPWGFNRDFEVVQLMAADGAGRAEQYGHISFPWPLVLATGEDFDRGSGQVYATREDAIAGARHLLGCRLQSQASIVREARAATLKAEAELANVALRWATFNEAHPLPPSAS